MQSNSGRDLKSQLAGKSSTQQLEAVLAAAMEEYLEQLELGATPDRNAIIQKHPKLASELDSCLKGIDFVHQLGLTGNGVAGEIQAPETIQPTATIGDYRIICEIGRGGMGVVYKAEQLSLGRSVALKVLPFAAVLDHKQIQRFKNEARAAGTLDHPNIVPVISVGQDRGVYHYAMSLIEGQSLAEVISELKPPVPSPRQEAAASGQTGSGERARSPKATRRGEVRGPDFDTAKIVQAALSTERSRNKHAFYRIVATLGIQAAEALHHAHERGVVHRDVKPGNLLLDATGKLWVTDFGLAHLESAVGMTMTGDVMGTIRYMSPEQALAKRSLIDHRTDIYSLGVTLYELLTFHVPFEGNDHQELLQHIAFNEPKSPRKIDPTIPYELDTILLKSLAKSPQDRYATAEELANDLGRFLDDKPILAKTTNVVRSSQQMGTSKQRCGRVRSDFTVGDDRWVSHQHLAGIPRDQCRVSRQRRNGPSGGRWKQGHA